MAEPMLAHNVFFTLKDNSLEARERLVDSCHKYLSGHPGTVFYSAGILENDLRRDVNDLEFDVALHVVFESRAAHDDYQVAALHQKFIDENRENWSRVRVFDSLVSRPAE